MKTLGGKPFTTGTDGKTIVTVDERNESRTILVLSADRKFGGVVTDVRDDLGKELVVTLRPTVRVKGNLECKELGARAEPAYTWVAVQGSSDMIVETNTKSADFEFVLPVGMYTLLCVSSDARGHTRLTLTDDRAEHDCGTLDLKASAIAKMRGKTPPDLVITDARGAKAEVKLADYKGKWVYLEFWGFW
jgi:hypothetical protein